MTQLQEKLFEILKEFDSFCRKHQIVYYMLGGTMLGAYRHQGFIPWDDDVDVGIPRKDYERFLSLARKQYTKEYVLRNHNYEKEIPFAFSHIEDRRTTCIEHRRNKDSYTGGVYIEIFPLDGCSNSIWMQKWQAFQVSYYKRILYGLILDYNQKYRVFYKAILIKLIRKYCKIDNIISKISKCISKYCLEESDYICNHLGHWGRKENVQKQYFGMPKEYLFEGILLLGVKEPERYLTQLYGKDYMIPPSLEEQEQGKHPAFYLNLNLPFEEYNKTGKCKK